MLEVGTVKRSAYLASKAPTCVPSRFAKKRRVLKVAIRRRNVDAFQEMTRNLQVSVIGKCQPA
jgi:hypothetical protein